MRRVAPFMRASRRSLRAPSASSSATRPLMPSARAGALLAQRRGEVGRQLAGERHQAGGGIEAALLAPVDDLAPRPGRSGPRRPRPSSARRSSCRAACRDRTSSCSWRCARRAGQVIVARCGTVGRWPRKRDRVQGRACSSPTSIAPSTATTRHARAPSVRDRRADDDPAARRSRSTCRPTTATARLDFARACGSPSEARALAEGPDRPARPLDRGRPARGAAPLVKASGARRPGQRLRLQPRRAGMVGGARRRGVGRAGNVDAWLVPSEQSRAARLARATQHAAAGQPAGRHRLGRRRRRDRSRSIRTGSSARSRDERTDARTERPTRCSTSGSARPAARNSAARARPGSPRTMPSMRQIARALRRADRARRCAASSRLGRRRRARRWRRCSSSTSSRATRFAARRARSPAMRGALAAASRMVGSRQDERCRRSCAASSTCRSSTPRAWRCRTRRSACSRVWWRPRPSCADMLDYARRHRAVIERFGRFPHRNDILGRQSTAEEIACSSSPARASSRAWRVPRYGRRGLSG